MTSWPSHVNTVMSRSTFSSRMAELLRTIFQDCEIAMSGSMRVSKETSSWPRVSLWNCRQNHLHPLQLYLICLLPSPGLSPRLHPSPGLHPAGFRFGPLLLLRYAVVRVSPARRHDNAGCRGADFCQSCKSLNLSSVHSSTSS